jgi:hypothetical protein
VAKISHFVIYTFKTILQPHILVYLECLLSILPVSALTVVLFPAPSDPYQLAQIALAGQFYQVLILPTYLRIEELDDNR